MSKPTHSKITRQHSNRDDRGFVSDSELDSLLEEVEKNRGKKLKATKNSPSRSSAGDRLFTKEDEKALKEICDTVERRKTEYEELRLAASESGDLKENDCESVSSKSSDETESDNESSSSKVSDDDSSEQEPTDDEVESTSDDEKDAELKKTKQNYTKKEHKKCTNYYACSTTPSSLKNKKGLPKSGLVKKEKMSDFGDKIQTRKVQNSSPCKGRANHQSDEELDSMVAELLEF